ncbi:MAG: type III pantothenate kinase [Candidatus Omnitrophica bacterium]|nr:type III pantothenate kinase [Candidatus Omnitrophota bacterium]
MLLAIEIGNTNINMAVFRGKRLLRRYLLPTRSKQYRQFLKGIFKSNKIQAVILCSVVPQATIRLQKELLRLCGLTPLIIGKDLQVPIKNMYRRPGQVGQDRLVNAYAGMTLYGAPLIVVDFGTAITFDVISKKKEYLGGMIVPGLQISLDALASRTALLPKLKVAKPSEFIGRDTVNSILSGIVYGFACLTEGLSARINKEIGQAPIIGTGGDVALFSVYLKNLFYVDRDLTLKGLNMLYLYWQGCVCKY